MTRRVQEVESELQVLNKQDEDLSSLILLAKKCMDTCEEEDSYLTFWSRQNRLNKIRRKLRFKRFIKKVKLKVLNFFV